MIRGFRIPFIPWRGARTDAGTGVEPPKRHPSKLLRFPAPRKPGTTPSVGIPVWAADKTNMISFMRYVARQLDGANATL